MLEVNPFTIGIIVDDRYELMSHIGDGGMGSVFKARELGLERVVALKILHSDLVADEENRLRFDRECKILSQLSHPNLVIFYRFGIWQKSRPYIAMEYLQGVSLRQVIDESGRLALPVLLRIGIQICNAMQVAHNQGIVHRDLKPNNIMIAEAPSPDSVKVVDFGMARLAGSTTVQRLTQTGELVGSVYYMSPEQCTGASADARSDIYSLGCLLYEAACGRPPFISDSPIGILHKHVSENPPPMIDLVSTEPAAQWLQNVLFKAMSKTASARYQTMSAFGDDLEKLQSQAYDRLSVDNTLPVSGKSSTRFNLRAMTCTASLTALVVIVTVGFRLNSESSRLEKEPVLLESDGEIGTLKAEILRLERRLAMNTSMLEKNRTLFTLFSRRNTLITKCIHSRQFELSEKLLTQQAQITGRIQDNDKSAAKVCARYAALYRAEAFSTADVSRQEFLRKRALVKIEQAVRLLHGRPDSLVSQIHCATLLELGRISEAASQFSSDLKNLRTGEPFATSVPYMESFAREISANAPEAANQKDKLAVCDLLMEIHEDACDRYGKAMRWSTGVTIQSKPDKQIVKLAETWLRKAYPVAPRKEQDLMEYRKRRQRIDSSLSSDP